MSNMRLFSPKLIKVSQNLPSAAVLIGIQKVKTMDDIFSHIARIDQKTTVAVHLDKTIYMRSKDNQTYSTKQ